MTVEGFIITLIIGAIAGWLAGQIVKGYGFGIIGNIIVGIFGGLIAGWLFPAVGWSFGSPVLGSIIAATLGAIILLVVIGFFRRAA